MSDICALTWNPGERPYKAICIEPPGHPANHRTTSGRELPVETNSTVRRFLLDRVVDVYTLKVGGGCPLSF